MSTVEKRKWCMAIIERYKLELQQQMYVQPRGTRYTVYKPMHFGLLSVCDGLNELYLFLDGYDAGVRASTFEPKK
jgi:hypothetical protein